MPPLAGFIYPNEVETQWSLLIVLYPYITGLVAGAFIVSALYHVFGIQSLKPLARFSLLTALAFLLVAPLPLQAHLGRPERAFEIFLTPNFTSAMAGFGYIWMGYLLLLSAEVWLVFRRDIVQHMEYSTGVRRLIYSVLSLGSHDVSEKALHFDDKLIKVLATIGIPAAALLHGYVGFIFGAVKANPWWSTPLMPVIFLLSAIVSGTALLLVLYVVVSRLRRSTVDHVCVASVAKWLMGFLIIDVALEGLEVLSMAYEKEESWEVIQQLITQKLVFSYLGIQLLLGSLIPFIILVTLGMVKLPDRTRTGLAFLASLLILIGVFAMRWNVVIGGQLVSKSFRGFLSYVPPLTGREGVLVAALIFSLPFVLFGIITYLLPPWERVPRQATPVRGLMPFPERQAAPGSTFRSSRGTEA